MGLFLGNPGEAGAGGVIRNHCGVFLSGFAVSLGHRTNNYAELMGFTNIHIELDSQIVIHWLDVKRCGLWY